MTIPLEQAREIVKTLDSGRIQNLFAQSHAKHVLYEVDEKPENFPAFDEQLEDKVTIMAYGMLAAGCSMIEQEALEEGASALESAASLLLNSHGPFVTVSRLSAFHALVASMAFYSAGHYSRAFVTIRKIESATEMAGIIAAFIRKDIAILIHRINEIVLRPTPEFDDQAVLDEWAISLATTRAIAYVIEYLLTGNKEHLNTVDQCMNDASAIAIAGFSPSQWWIVRLLKLMLRNLQNASLWKVLPPFFGPTSERDLSLYIRSLAFSNPPVIELWTSQRSTLALALDPLNSGGVINLRTSAGKTRVAELAILQVLSFDPTAKIVYLAPFRSLAFEVERTLSQSFSPLGFHVSHLYGGSRISTVDTELTSESAITIGTPEKIRALFRAAPELFEKLRLIVIDEGHLIGGSQRDVRNEIFVDHLRTFAQANGARILLLSAVLPNTKELAEWITGDPAAVAASPWKPSAERFGKLRWNGSRVAIEWIGKTTSFNPWFVEAKPISTRANSKRFPSTKNEAIAASAIRLTSIGPVMIFSGKARSVPSLAKSVLFALGNAPIPHPWPIHEWKVFEAVCSEELAPNAIELRAARVGVICHSNDLPGQVRMAIESLMRSHAPKIIIATTTLGQGVNIGISSVIVATPYIGRDLEISKRDFWNICGRAGRAFIDGEGKVLYAIDEVKTKTRTSKQIAKDERLAEWYFDSGPTDRVESGIRHIVNHLQSIAAQSQVQFDVLLELVANNDFSRFGEQSSTFETSLDLLDDEILAMNEDASINQSINESVAWVDQVFRHSLAAIQARANGTGINENDLIRFLTARAKSLFKRIPDKADRKSITSSGLPLSIAILARRDIDYFRFLADIYLASDSSIEALNVVIKCIEDWARANAVSIVGNIPDESELDRLRDLWVSGVGLRELIEVNPNASDICKDLFGYQLPWIINAISQKFNKDLEQERVEVFSKIALLTELGVPNELAARIFLAGIRSRVAATELAELDVFYGKSILTVSRNLRDTDFIATLSPLLSPASASWLELLSTDEARRKIAPFTFLDFTLNSPTSAEILYPRGFKNQLFLCSLDGTEKFEVGSSEQLPFDKVIDDPAFAFTRSDGVWSLVVRNPKRIVKSKL